MVADRRSFELECRVTLAAVGRLCAWLSLARLQLLHGGGGRSEGGRSANCRPVVRLGHVGLRLHDIGLLRRHNTTWLEHGRICRYDHVGHKLSMTVDVAISCP